MKIAYEPHPVSAERKAELRSQGFKIIDAAFAPADWKAPDAIQAKEAETKTDAPAPVKRRGRKPKTENA